MRKIIRVVASPTSLDVFLKEQMVYLSSDFEVIGVASPGEGHEKVRAAGIRTEEINIERPIRIWSDIKSLWKLYTFFRKEKPDIVHSITPKAGLLSMTAAWLARVPVRMHTFTGLLFPWKRGVLKAILKTTDRITCLFATFINPEGYGVREQLKQGRITWKPLHIIANGHINGINPDKFVAKGHRSSRRKELNIEDTDIVFAFTGRLTKDKGIVDLQQAFKLLQTTKSNTHLLLIGEQEPLLDPLPDDCIAWLTSHPNVHMVGQVDDVPSWLEAADIFVFPSHREGLPTALLEACASRLPCIATNICGCTEIIEHLKTGLLVPPSSPTELYNAMLKLINITCEQRACFAESAYDKVIREYSTKHIRKEQLNIYESLITHSS